MKRIVLSMVILAFAGSVCFAQPAANAPAQPASHPKDVTKKVFAGKVESVSIADPAKGTKSEVVVLDEAGKKMTFLVKATTTFYEGKGVAATLDKVKVNEKVKVKYETTKEGVEEAKSIRIIQ